MHPNSSRSRSLTFTVVVGMIAVVQCSNAAFSKFPYSQLVTVGDKAIFKCQHFTADIITWIVNGTSVAFNQEGYAPKSDYIVATSRISLSDDPVHILSIVALPKFNQTKIECMAYFADGSPAEQSDPAILIINDHEVLHHNNTHTYTNRVVARVLIIVVLVTAIIVLPLAISMRRLILYRVFLGGYLAPQVHPDIERGSPLIVPSLSQSLVLQHSIIVIPHNNIMTTSEEQSLTIESPDSSCPLLSNTDMKPITYKQSMAPQENNTMPYYYTYDSNKHKPIEHSPQKEGMLKETVQECQETIDKSTTTHKVFTSSTCTHPYITSPTPTVRPTTDPVLSHPGHLKGLSSPSAYKASFKGHLLNTPALFMGHNNMTSCEQRYSQLSHSTILPIIKRYSSVREEPLPQLLPCNELVTEEIPDPNKDEHHELRKRYNDVASPGEQEGLGIHPKDETELLPDFHSNFDDELAVSQDCQNMEKDKNLLICGQNIITSSDPLIFSSLLFLSPYHDVNEVHFNNACDCTGDDMGDFVSGKDPILADKQHMVFHTTENILPWLSDERHCLINYLPYLRCFPYNVEPDYWSVDISNNTPNLGTHFGGRKQTMRLGNSRESII